METTANKSTDVKTINISNISLLNKYANIHLDSIDNNANASDMCCILSATCALLVIENINIR